MRSPQTARGLTLIEVTIALGIAAMLVGIAIPAVSSITRAALRQKTGQLASGLRSLYGQSAISGKSCRLVIDLEAGAYHAECAKGEVRLSSEGERSRNGVRELSKEEELAARSAKERDSLTEEEKTRLDLLSKNAFVASSEIPKTELGKSVHFKRVWVSHQQEAYVGGIAYLYFWPSGQTEAASLQLQQGDDILSLVVSPLTGQVRIVQGAATSPGEH